MIGIVLRELHQEISRLAVPVGEFELTCAHAQPSPFLLANRRFVSSTDAERASRAVRLYWTFLRRLDPTVALRQPTIAPVTHPRERPRAGASPNGFDHFPRLRDPRETSPRSVEYERQHIYAQELLGLPLELLAVRGCRSVHRELLSAYLAAGDRYRHAPVSLGRALLSAVVEALAGHFEAGGQTEVLDSLVGWLCPPDPRTVSPVRAALDDLCALGLLTDGTAKPLAPAGAGRSEQWRVRLDEYVFLGDFEEILVVPVALEVARHAGECSIAITDIRVERPETVTFVVSLDAHDPEGVLLASTATERL